MAQATYDGGTCVSAPSSPDYEDVWEIEPDKNAFGETVFGTGIRPMLRLETEKLSDTIALAAGDQVMISTEPFTYPSRNIPLLNPYLFDGFSYGVFDEATNRYEDSAAKKTGDAWFESLIKPCLN